MLPFVLVFGYFGFSNNVGILVSVDLVLLTLLLLDLDLLLDVDFLKVLTTEDFEEDLLLLEDLLLNLLLTVGLLNPDLLLLVSLGDEF